VAFKEVKLYDDYKATEVLVFWDDNENGVFDKDTDELNLYFTSGGCAMCVRGLDRTDMLPYMVKNQPQYSGKTFIELRAIAAKTP
jgi:hypothetical protein